MLTDQPEGGEGACSTAAASKKVIYDIGANNGGDLPYYLKKAGLVVAVEANPSLCRQIEQQFGAEIDAGRLRVENCVLVGGGESSEVAFYLHRRHHVLGRFSKPDESVAGDFVQVALPAQTVKQLLARHGAPYYLKIDVEGYDGTILRELLETGMRPPFISAESTGIEVFALLAGLGDYRAFKLVEGADVAKDFSHHPISVDGKSERYSFPPHSAGPFGEDIPGAWMNADDLFELLARRKMGWRDIHATNLVQPDQSSRAQQRRLFRRHFRGWLQSRLRR